MHLLVDHQASEICLPAIQAEVECQETAQLHGTKLSNRISQQHESEAHDQTNRQKGISLTPEKLKLSLKLLIGQSPKVRNPMG